MKDFLSTPAQQAIKHLGQYATILDARSPGEFEEDHLPNARSSPVLSNEQRTCVGTINKEQSAFEAKRRGAALVSRNIANLLEGPLSNLNRDGKILVYCWRGGQRSGSLATTLARIGYRVDQLDGGYRAFRKELIASLDYIAPTFQYQVLVGRTGSGKSLLLQVLASMGAQVLDLERLARHKGSVLGLIPGDTQPSQKRFETLIWQQLKAFDPAQPVFVESESKKVGQCQVPETLIAAMRASPCLNIQASMPTRIALLKQDYAYFVQHTEHLDELCEKLAQLKTLHSQKTVEQWQGQAKQGAWDDLVQGLLEVHYDPAYDRSIKRNFVQVENAKGFELLSESAVHLALCAENIKNASLAKA